MIPIPSERKQGYRSPPPSGGGRRRLPASRGAHTQWERSAPQPQAHHSFCRSFWLLLPCDAMRQRHSLQFLQLHQLHRNTSTPQIFFNSWVIRRNTILTPQKYFDFPIYSPAPLLRQLVQLNRNTGV